jgi:hypothetical protein
MVLIRKEPRTVLTTVLGGRGELSGQTRISRQARALCPG